MKHKTISYINAVKRIKSLPKRSEKRSAAIAEAAERFGVPVRTIYHDCTKPFSKIGIRQKRKDAGKTKVKITAREEKIFNELIQAGYTKAEAKKITEEKMNKKISDRTKTKLGKKLENETIKDDAVSSFGSDMKKFLEKLFNFDKIAPGKKIKIKFKNKTVFLSKRAISNIFMIVASEYNVNEFKEEKKLKLDGDLLLMAMLKYQLSEQMAIATENNNLDAFNTISLILTRLKDNIKDYSPNFRVMYKVIREEFKKTITKAELVGLIEKYYSEEINNA